MMNTVLRVIAYAVASALLTSCWSPGNPGILRPFLPRPTGSWDSKAGRSIDDAVVITHMEHDMDLDVTETAWVNGHLGSHAIIMDAKAIERKGRKLQEIRCELPSEKTILIYFDVTDVSEEQRSQSLAERHTPNQR